MSERSCENCHVKFPLTQEYWHRSNSSGDGYRKTCKMCRAEDREQVRKEEMDERLRKVEEGGFDLLDKIAKGGSEVPHMAETFQRLMEVFGGPGGFAQHYMATFLKGTPSQKKDMMLGMMRLNVVVSESGAANRSLEEITEEELDRAIEKTTREIMQVDPTTRPFNGKLDEPEKAKEPHGQGSAGS